MSRGRRMVCILFPHLAMERWRARRGRAAPSDERPLVLARDGAHGPVIHAVGAAAHARGIREGARVVDAQAIHPDLRVEPADPAGDLAALDRLVLWARRWGPWTARDGPDGVVLDATGVSHLFGGEAELLGDIGRRFAVQGLTARPAMAPMRGAAWALARHGEPCAVCAEGDDRGAPRALARPRPADRRRGRAAAGAGWASRRSGRWPGCRGPR